MPLKVYIAGTEVYQAKFVKRGSLQVEERVNGRHVLSAVLMDRATSPVYRPGMLSAIVVTEAEESGTGGLGAGTTVVTLTSGGFSADDVGKTIEVFGAAAGSQPLWATITTYVSGVQVQISRAATLTVAGVAVRWGRRKFGGTVNSVTESAIGDDFGIESSVSGVDFNELVDRRAVKKTYAKGQTLKQVVTDLVTTYFAVFGVFVDPTMANGPTLEEQVFDYGSGRDALNHLSEITGWVWSIDYIRQLTMKVPTPGTTPVELKTGVNCNVLLGSEWTRDVADYRNVQIVRIGSGTQDKVDDFVGDGATRVFPLQYTPVTKPDQVEIPTASGTYRNVGVHGIDTLFEWTYRSSDNAIVQLADAPPGTPNAPVTNGVLFRTIPYAAAFPLAVSFTNGLEFALRGPYEKVQDAPDIFDRAAGEELAEGLVRKFDSFPKRVSLGTSVGREPLAVGIHAGQQGPITIAERQVSGQHLLEAVRSRDIGVDLASGEIDWFYEIDAIEGDEYQDSWVEWFQQLGGGSGGGSSVGGVLTGGGGGGGGPAGPGQFRVVLGVKSEADFFFAAAANTWFDAPGHIDWILVGSQIPGIVTMRVHLRSASANATIQARLVNTSTGLAASNETTGVNVNVATHREVPCTLIPDAAQVYRLQLRVTGSAATTAAVGYSKPTLENG